jgi:DnaJ like chaperone protein
LIVRPILSDATATIAGSAFMKAGMPLMDWAMPWDSIERAVGEPRVGRLRAVLARIGTAIGLGGHRGLESSRHGAAFTAALVALAAKMAKADGVAVGAEWSAFEKFLEVPAGEAANVKRIYDLAKEDLAGFDIYADRIAALLGKDAGLRRDVLECLFYVACSDGILHPAEDALLGTVGKRLGFDAAAFRQIRAQFVSDPGEPYEILGLSPEATDAQVRARYRRLAAESHPDVLIAAGAPAAVVKAATAKLAAINAAHEAIMKERSARGGA